MSAAPCEISVIVCTHRSPEAAQACLGTLRSLCTAGARLEVLVVDNTPGGLWRAAPPGVRVVREPRRGLSVARNAGARAAAGALLAYIDDDALAEPDWAARLLEPLQTDPAAGVVGGKVQLLLPADRPAWYDQALEGFWSRFEPPGMTVSEAMTYGQMPCGANLALRKTLWESLGGFDTTLGRHGRDFAGGEEVDLCLRARRAGWKVLLTPAAVVRHVIPPERLTLRHLWLTSRQAGRTLGRLGGEAPTAHLRRAAEQLAKSLYPFRRFTIGRRLNYLLWARLQLWAALTSRVPCAVEVLEGAGSAAP